LPLALVRDNSTSYGGRTCKKKRNWLYLPDRFNQYTVYFQINFQAFRRVFGLAHGIKGAGENTVAIAF
jgi:hypothetical protein